jgi:hypothetical protein
LAAGLGDSLNEDARAVRFEDLEALIEDARGDAAVALPVVEENGETTKTPLLARRLTRLEFPRMQRTLARR